MSSKAKQCPPFPKEIPEETKIGRRTFMRRLGLGALYTYIASHVHSDVSHVMQELKFLKPEDLGTYFETKLFNGIMFNIYIAHSLTDLTADDIEYIYDELEKASIKLENYIDIPENLELNFVVMGIGDGDNSGAISTQTIYVQDDEGILRPKEWHNPRIITMKAISATGILHELFHYVRFEQGIYTLSEGFEEGMASFVDNDALKKDGLKDRDYRTFGQDEWFHHDLSIVDEFLEHFPELENVAVDDEIQHYYTILDISPRAQMYPWISDYYYTIRRRAIARLLEECEEDLSLIKAISRAQVEEQKQNPKAFWYLEDLAELGPKIHPKFRNWLESEKVFDVGEEQKIIKAFEKDGVVNIMAIEISQLELLNSHTGEYDSRIPKVFSHKGIQKKCKIIIELRGQEPISISVELDKIGFSKVINLKEVLEQQLGLTFHDVDNIYVRIDGQLISVKRVN
ncbi:hypothetical protein ACFL21_00575 [Patescibacteria group bacterium]